MKALFLSLLLAATASAQAPLDPFGSAEDGIKSDEGLDGTWMRDEKGMTHIKHYFGGIFSSSRIDRNTGIIRDLAVGLSRYSPPSLKERAMVTSESWEDLLKHIFTSPVGFEGETIYAQRGCFGGKEVWMKQQGANTLQGVADFSSELTDLDGIWFTETAPVRTIKVLYRGRGVCTVFDLKKRQVLNQIIYIFSFDGKILQERVLYATNGWKSMIGTTSPYKMTWAGKGKVEQLHARGRVEHWTRYGPKPKVGKFEGVTR